MNASRALLGVALCLLAIAVTPAQEPGPSIEALIGRFRGSDKRAQAQAGMELKARFGETALPALLGVLEDPEPNVRRLAIWTISMIGPPPEAEPGLVRNLEHADPTVRDAAARALGKLSGNEPVVAALSRALSDDPAPSVRSSAATALSGSSNMPPAQRARAVEALSAALSDPDPSVRQFAAQATGSFNLRSHAALGVPALIEALSDPSADVRLQVAQALGAVGPPAALPALEPLRGLVGDREVRPAALSALAVIGKANTAGQVMILVEAYTVEGGLLVLALLAWFLVARRAWRRPTGVRKALLLGLVALPPAGVGAWAVYETLGYPAHHFLPPLPLAVLPTRVVAALSLVFLCLLATGWVGSKPQPASAGLADPGLDA